MRFLIAHPFYLLRLAGANPCFVLVFPAKFEAGLTPVPQFVKHFNRPVVRISVASIIRFYNLNKLATGSPREIRTASNSSFAFFQSSATLGSMHTPVSADPKGPAERFLIGLTSRSFWDRISKCHGLGRLHAPEFLFAVRDDGLLT